jgi:serine/threonine protein kinase/Tfp pilus assembly protein PilF
MADELEKTVVHTTCAQCGDSITGSDRDHSCHANDATVVGMPQSSGDFAVSGFHEAENDRTIITGNELSLKPLDPSSLEDSGDSLNSRQIKKPGQDMVGKVIDGKYEVLDLIGAGGMSAVFKAFHMDMDRIVAIKFVQGDGQADAETMRRFKREARAASLLNHPNVITVYDYGTTEEGHAYLTMDFLHGHSLQQVIRQEGVLSSKRALNIFLQVCKALSHAHEHGVVHRDLKPGNIMLISTSDEEDFVKIIDFGIAKVSNPVKKQSGELTQTGQVVGSPTYMAPEQLLGDPVDARTDIYAFGCVMYECLTGRTPFDGDTVFSVMHQHISDPPPPISEVNPNVEVPQELAQTVMQCLEKEPGKRFQTMKELRERLAEITDQTSSMVIVRVPRDKSKSTPVIKKPSKFMPLYIVAAALILAGAAYFVYNQINPPAAVVSGEGGDGLGPNSNQLVAAYQKELAQAYHDGHFDDAVKAGLMALKESENSKDVVQRAIIYSSLGKCYMAQSKYKQALEMFEKALPILEKELGPAEDATIGTLQMMGITYFNLQKYPEAESQLSRLLSVIESRPQGRDSADRATVLTMLGRIYYDTGRSTDSEAALEESMRITNDQPASPEKAWQLQSLAMIMLKQNETADAEKLLRDAIQIYQDHGMEKDKAIADSYRGLADAMTQKKNYIEAERFYRKAQGVYNQVGFDETIEMSNLLHNYARMLKDANRADEAGKMEAKAQAIDTATGRI